MRAEVSGLKTSRLARVVSEPVPRRRVTIGEVTTFPTSRRATFSSLTKNNVDEPSHTTQKASPDANAKQMHQNDKAQSSIVGNTRPIAISTTDLKPRTHKTITGQITILPSHSLLIDFREGERRKGQTGDQVLVVSHGGSHVREDILRTLCFRIHNEADRCILSASPERSSMPGGARVFLFLGLHPLRLLETSE